MLVMAQFLSQRRRRAETRTVESGWASKSLSVSQVMLEPRRLFASGRLCWAKNRLKKYTASTYLPIIRRLRLSINSLLFLQRDLGSGRAKERREKKTFQTKWSKWKSKASEEEEGEYLGMWCEGEEDSCSGETQTSESTESREEREWEKYETDRNESQWATTLHQKRNNRRNSLLDLFASSSRFFTILQTLIPENMLRSWGKTRRQEREMITASGYLALFSLLLLVLEHTITSTHASEILSACVCVYMSADMCVADTHHISSSLLRQVIRMIGWVGK